MILELYGLTGSGKTHIARQLARCNLKKVEHPSKISKYLSSLIFIIKNPYASLYLLSRLNCNSCIASKKLGICSRLKLRAFRNVLLLSTMADYRVSSKSAGNFIIDEGFFQLIHTVYERKAGYPEIMKFIKVIPKPDILTIVEADLKTRNSRLAERDRPREADFGGDYFEKWHESMILNDLMLRKCLRAYHGRFKIDVIKNGGSVPSCPGKSWPDF